MNRKHAYKIRALSASLIALLLLLTLNLNSHFDFAQPNNQDDSKSAVQAQYASLPLAFEPNQGQADGSTQFLVHHDQATTYFDGANTTTTVGDDHVTMSLDGANTTNFTGTDQLESKTNYFIGNDQSKWHSNVPNYKQLLAKNVYPGIDLKYYGTNSQLEHDFIVNPGSDYKQIAFHFDGQNNLSMDTDGNLILKAGGNDLKLNAPTTYQTSSNSKHTIPSHFELIDNTVTVALNENYDHSQPLIIDPVLIYSSYLGGSADDGGKSIGIDPSGNVYVAGYTTSTNFPTASPYQGTAGGGTYDAFVTKFNPTGSALVYSTYLGGSVDDNPWSIAVDLSGNVYVTGHTSSTNFPVVAAYQGTKAGIAGTTDAFITKLNAAGSALTYSTYLGGTGNEFGFGIAVDGSQNAYVVGSTTSTNLPTASPYQGTSGGGSGDGFIAKFNSTGSASYVTYLGGTANDVSYDIASDSSGNAYVAGRTTSTDFPTASPFQASNGGGASDEFVAKFNPAGSALLYSTYLGGSGDEDKPSIEVDTSGSAYIAGQTTSTNFPTASPYQTSSGGGTDAFITKLNAAGSAATYSTYLGGSGTDIAYGIAVNGSNEVYVTGQTTSSNFPTVSAFQGSNAGGGGDAFVTKLNATGSTPLYSTYIGGTGLDFGQGVVASLADDAYIAGETTSTNFPTVSAYQASNAGSTDAFVTHLTLHTVDISGTVTGTVAPILTFTISSTTCNLGTLSTSQAKSCTHTMTAGTNATNGYVISYIPTATLTSGANTISAMTSQTGSSLDSEQYGLNLKANTAAGSFTAADFGADPSGGVGVAFGNYNNANQFKFTTAGDNIAQSTTTSADTTYTVSYIANINSLTEAGLYAATMTYNIVASY